MDFGKILQRAWYIIWNNKILWLFGILASCGNAGGGGGGGGGNFSFDASSGNYGNIPPEMRRFFFDMERFFNNMNEGEVVGFVFAIIAIAIVLSLIVFLISTFGRVALIKGAHQADGGQSLGFGFNMISEEMNDPIAKEFGRTFEEQNLGVPIEESLRNLTERIPNLDLKFFVTAVFLQRQTGGDLAEILDKIGELIRDRFRIWGQVQALTGEGRLSGIVLLALPFVLFIAVYQLNPDYIKVLFTDPMGKKLLAIAIFMQVVGALVIRKIVNIKV